MRICMILEGCYPYVRGGVSSWVHNYMQAMPQHEFVLWVIGAESKNKGRYLYELPSNVVEVHEVFLDSALNIPVIKKAKVKFTPAEIDAHLKLMNHDHPDWPVLFDVYNRKHVNVNTFLMSEEFLEMLLTMCHKDFPFISFAELFHTVRSMLLPMLYLISQDIPQADIYHSSSTGYGGLLGSMAGVMTNKPYVLTEHGIYSREREEEILRAAWVPHYFKRLWISQFFELAKLAYDTAASVTALFSRANAIQEELGCPHRKQKVIFNGIYTDQFIHIPPKEPNEYIDICAIVRFHPIKDLKTMIYSFFELKMRVPNARLHILGDTDDEEYRAECVELIRQLDVQDILLVGNTNVPEYLKGMDFTVLTSISEGQPLSVLESMAAGRPCVATDVGCCRELITGETIDSFGAAGYITKPMHVQAIANAMEFLCKHEEERLQMGEAGKKRILQSFTHQDMIRQYENNYFEVLRVWQGSGLN